MSNHYNRIKHFIDTIKILFLGGKMYILIILVLVAILMAVALVGTLLVTKERDVVYSGEKSIANQAWIYIALIPFLVIAVGIVFWL